MQLNGKAIRALKPREKPGKVTGNRGLHLHVTALGSRFREPAGTWTSSSS